MREKDQNYTCKTQETEEAFAFAMFLTNVLLLTVIGALAWLAHFVLTDNNSLNVIVRGGLMQ